MKGLFLQGRHPLLDFGMINRKTNGSYFYQAMLLSNIEILTRYFSSSLGVIFISQLINYIEWIRPLMLKTLSGWHFSSPDFGQFTVKCPFLGLFFSTHNSKDIT
ncbi:MAG: hypothetical protein P9M05_05500 [Candidatus Stygibacter australis]|nr:hypothetical protein [Candidatus Stygibacter australis]